MRRSGHVFRRGSHFLTAEQGLPLHMGASPAVRPGVPLPVVFRALRSCSHPANSTTYSSARPLEPQQFAVPVGEAYPSEAINDE